MQLGRHARVVRTVTDDEGFTWSRQGHRQSLRKTELGISDGVLNEAKCHKKIDMTNIIIYIYMYTCICYPRWKVYHISWFVVTRGELQTQMAFHPVDLACFEVKSLVAGTLMVIEDCFL